MTRPAPWSHQAKLRHALADMRAAAIFWEQRVGKTRPTIENAGDLFARGEIDSMIVLAPNGVHRNWVTDELPAWADFPYEAVTWRAARAGTKTFKEEIEGLLKTPKLAVLAINVEALPLDATKAYLARFLASRKVMAVADEAQVLKTPGARRTKVAVRVGARAAYRRILSGTPNPESPFELYSQFGFLDPAILGFSNYHAFCRRHAEFETGYGAHGSYQKVVTNDDGTKAYRRLDELERKIAPHTFRLRRDQCGDLPPVTFQKRYFQLAKAQLDAIQGIKDEHFHELASGEKVGGAVVLTRMVRMQQIASNILVPLREAQRHEECGGTGCVDCDGLGLIVPEAGPAKQLVPDDDDPRLAALLEELRTAAMPVIVWSRWTQDVERVHRKLTSMGLRGGMYYGPTPDDERDRIKRAFRARELDFMSGNHAAGGRGQDFSAALTTIFYANYFALEPRLQGQDRMINLGDPRPKSVVDLVAEASPDEDIIPALRSKRSLSALVLGDPDGKWI